MGELRKIEIVCIPCHKCDVIREKIQIVLKCIEFTFSIRLNCRLIYYTNRKEAMKAVIKSGYSFNELPVTRINGAVAFTGSRISESGIRLILEGILKY
jgi:hypothetical protein